MCFKLFYIIKIPLIPHNFKKNIFMLIMIKKSLLFTGVNNELTIISISRKVLKIRYENISYILLRISFYLHFLSIETVMLCQKDALCV